MAVVVVVVIVVLLLVFFIVVGGFHDTAPAVTIVVAVKITTIVLRCVCFCCRLMLALMFVYCLYSGCC